VVLGCSGLGVPDGSKIAIRLKLVNTSMQLSKGAQHSRHKKAAFSGPIRSWCCGAFTMCVGSKEVNLMNLDLENTDNIDDLMMIQYIIMLPPLG